MDILDFTAAELALRIKRGEIRVEEAVRAVFERIREQEEYCCYITLDQEGAFKRAARVQQKVDSGEYSGLLCGVPVAVKDNLCTKGLLTTCGSRILENFVPPYSATAVKNLEAAGAVLIGKTNMDEFGMGSTTETSAYGVTKNPWSKAHVPGGSSGGSAAAVALSECYAALGSDTGGSVRQPAAFCGVVGMKPTYGTVSRYGLIAYASSLDQIGPICKDVTDCAAMLEAVAAHDPLDSTSQKRRDLSFTSALQDDVRGMKIGIPEEYFGAGLDPLVRKAVLLAAEVLRERGALVEWFHLNLTDYGVPAYYVLAAAEASSNLERFDGVKYGYRADGYEGLQQMYKKTRSEGFGPEVKRRIMLGTFVLSSGYYDAYYMKALKVKRLIKEEFNQAFQSYDLILGPAAPGTAPRIGESLPDPLKMYLGDIYTVTANLAGLPGICLPCGMDAQGLPIGLQLTGDCFQEHKLIRAAYSYEQENGRFTGRRCEGGGKKAV